MKEQEAIKWIEARLASGPSIDEPYQAGLIAIIAIRKQIPFKPETDKLVVGVGRCKCKAEFLDRKTNYCGNCGQKLDWSKNDER